MARYSLETLKAADPMALDICDKADRTVRYNQDRLEREVASLRSGWLDDQIGYFKKTEARYHALDDLLNITLPALFILAFLACIGHLVGLYPLGLKHFELLGTAVGPALAASLLGIATHAEWARLRRLYRARAGHYRDVRDRLDSLLSRKGEIRRQDLETILGPLALSSVVEVADWRWLHAVHDPHLHG